MNESLRYVPSKLLTGEGEVLRNHSLTRWLSRDLLQASVDFSKNMGLVPVFAETKADGHGRFLFWRPPAGVMMEVRSGRTREKFEDFDRHNQEREWVLLSLHIAEGESYSGVWISSSHYESGKAFLARHGITAAERVLIS